MDLANNNTLGRPIRSLQTFLRAISFEYPEVPRIIPDGYFGPQTKDAVVAFQRSFNLEPNGVVDNVTWDKIVAVYAIVAEKNREPRAVQIFPSPTFSIQPGDHCEDVYPIQALLVVLANRFGNLETVELTGANDERTVKAVQRVQEISGQEPNGVIDRETWDNIARLYESYVSRNWVERQYGSSLYQP